MNIIQFIIIVTVLVILNSAYVLTKNKIINSNPLTTEGIEESSSKKLSNITKYILILVSLFALTGGLWGINHWLHNYNYAKESINWNPVKAKIIDKSTGPNSRNRSESEALAGRTFCPKVKYQFNYNNESITFGRIDYSNRVCSGDRKHSEMVLKLIPDVGEEATVFVSPTERQAVLFPGTDNMDFKGLMISSVFFFLGLSIIRFAIL